MQARGVQVCLTRTARSLLGPLSADVKVEGEDPGWGRSSRFHQGRPRCGARPRHWSTALAAGRTGTEAYGPATEGASGAKTLDMALCL